MRKIITVFAIITLCIPCFARLSSTKEQESRMVAAAMRVSEKLFQRLNDTYGKQTDYADEIALLSKEAGGYEDGILNDMAIANDVARLLVYSQYKNPRFFVAMDDFDRAADQLGTPDRKRYYLAKSRLRSRQQAPFIDSTRKQWFFCLGADCRRAARCGYDAEKCAAPARTFAEKNGIEGRLLDESLCRITQDYARYFVAEAYRLSRTREYEKALKPALQGIKEIPPLTVLADTTGCTKWKSEGVLVARYDSLFVRPLTVYTGAYGDQISIAVCKRYWQYRQLVASVIVRIVSPSSDAFDLFEKAGEDEILQHDGRIAAAEMRLWGKTGKLSEFKKKFPDRYRLARRTVSRRR